MAPARRRHRLRRAARRRADPGAGRGDRPARPAARAARRRQPPRRGLARPRGLPDRLARRPRVLPRDGRPARDPAVLDAGGSTAEARWFRPTRWPRCRVTEVTAEALRAAACDPDVTGRRTSCEWQRRRRIAAYGLCRDDAGRVLLVRAATGLTAPAVAAAGRRRSPRRAPGRRRGPRGREETGLGVAVARHARRVADRCSACPTARRCAPGSSDLRRTGRRRRRCGRRPTAAATAPRGSRRSELGGCR